MYVHVHVIKRLRSAPCVPIMLQILETKCPKAVHVHVHTCTCTCTCMYMYVHVHARTCTCTYMYGTHQRTDVKDSLTKNKIIIICVYVEYMCVSFRIK